MADSLDLNDPHKLFNMKLKDFESNQTLILLALDQSNNEIADDIIQYQKLRIFTDSYFRHYSKKERSLILSCSQLKDCNFKVKIKFIDVVQSPNNKKYLQRKQFINICIYQDSICKIIQIGKIQITNKIHFVNYQNIIAIILIDFVYDKLIIKILIPKYQKRINRDILFQKMMEVFLHQSQEISLDCQELYNSSVNGDFFTESQDFIQRIYVFLKELQKIDSFQNYDRLFKYCFLGYGQLSCFIINQNVPMSEVKKFENLDLKISFKLDIYDSKLQVKQNENIHDFPIFNQKLLREIYQHYFIPFLLFLKNASDFNIGYMLFYSTKNLYKSTIKDFMLKIQQIKQLFDNEDMKNIDNFEFTQSQIRHNNYLQRVEELLNEGIFAYGFTYDQIFQNFKNEVLQKQELCKTLYNDHQQMISQIKKMEQESRDLKQKYISKKQEFEFDIKVLDHFSYFKNHFFETIQNDNLRKTLQQKEQEAQQLQEQQQKDFMDQIIQSENNTADIIEIDKNQDELQYFTQQQENLMYKILLLILYLGQIIKMTFKKLTKMNKNNRKKENLKIKDKKQIYKVYPQKLYNIPLIKNNKFDKMGIIGLVQSQCLSQQLIYSNMLCDKK